MSKSNFTPEQKPASDLTKKKNRDLAEEFGLSLEDTTNEELELARKNCIKKLIDHSSMTRTEMLYGTASPLLFSKRRPLLIQSIPVFGLTERPITRLVFMRS